MPRVALFVSLLLFAFSVMLVAGCASTQPDEEPPPVPVDTTGFRPAEPEPAPEPEPELPSQEELERRRLEQQRLAEQRRQQQEAADRQSIRTVLFAYDASTLSASARNDLRHNAELLRKYPQWSIIVEGHCDERGSTEYNLALGERRAHAVKQYYADYGVDAGRIRLISYGEERPAVSGSNEAAWAKNRRAVTIAR